MSTDAAEPALGLSKRSADPTQDHIDVLFESIEPLRDRESGMDYWATETSTFVVARRG